MKAPKTPPDATALELAERFDVDVARAADVISEARSTGRVLLVDFAREFARLQAARSHFQDDLIHLHDGDPAERASMAQEALRRAAEFEAAIQAFEARIAGFGSRVANAPE